MGLICRGISLCLKYMRIRRYRKKYEKAKKLGATTSPLKIKKMEMTRLRRKKFLLDVSTGFIFRKKSYDETIAKIKSILTHREMFQFLFFIYGLIFSWILFAVSYYVGSDDRSILVVKNFALVTSVSFAIAYSRQLRAITILLTPIVLTSKGRYVILVMIANLLLYGPITNMRINLSEYGRIIKCVAAVIWDQIWMFIDQNPVVNFFRSLFKKLNEMFKQLNAQLDETLRKMKTLFKALVGVLEAAADYCRNVINHAKRILASIGGDCSYIIDAFYRGCVAKTGLNTLCHGVYVLQPLCWIFDLMDAIDLPTLPLPGLLKKFTDLIENAVRKLLEKWDQFEKAFIDFFSLGISVQHQKTITKHEKTSYSSAIDELHKKIDSRMGFFVDFCKLLSNISYLLLFYCVLRAWLYLKRFRMWDSFDNVYITKSIAKIDWERSLAGKSTILPLGYILKQKYITPFSLKMTSDELRKLHINLVIFFTFLVCIGTFMILEHIVYAPLGLTKKYIANVDAEFPLPTLKIYTQPEEGVMADMVQRVGDMSSNIGNITDSIDTIAKCTPDPIEPDYELYENIGLLVLTVLFAIMCESYALRMRFLIAGFMYPSRKFARANWLYNKILASSPMAKQDAKDKIRAKVFGDAQRSAPSQIKRMMYLNFFTAKLYDLFAGKQKYCIVCAQSGPLYDTFNFIKCINIDCKAVYCKPCYSEFDKACPLCETVKLDPRVAAIDEEKGSSEDEEIFEYVYDDDWTFRGPDTESEPEIDFKKLDTQPPKNFARYLTPRNVEDGPVDSDDSTSSAKKNKNVKHRSKFLK